MSIDFSWQLNGLRHSAATAPAGQTGAVTPTPGKPSTSDRTQSSPGTTDTSGIREDFRAWLTEETEKIVAEGGSAADVTGVVRESIGAGESSGTKTSSDSNSASLNEMKLLIDSLDKSILGNVGSSLNSEEVASDLLSGGLSSQRVIDQLVGGHLNSIVMTAGTDLENADDNLESDVTESLKDVSTETLAQNLETIMAKLGGMGS
ncbi:hypothetical protein SAMN02910292_03084 [Lachnospiraceae bacterium XBB2008]|nr:hypothetical protein SAMN02910292_03084 [Lachnospiraceae bacterium XBB2008]